MSNRNSIIIRIIIWGAVAIFLLSALAMLTSKAASGKNAWNTDFWGDLRTVQEESFSLSAVNELEFDFSSMDIELYLTKEDELRVKLLSNRELLPDERFVSSAEAGRIVVQSQPHVSVFPFNLGSINVFRKLEVYLPEQYAEALKMKTASGNMTLPEELTLKTVKLHLSSGDLRGGTIQAEDFALGVTSGNIRLSQVKSAHYEIGMTSGDITMEAVAGIGSIGSSSGNIRVGSVSGGEQDISTTSGNISVDQFTGYGEIGTQSGNVKIDSALPQGDMNVRVTSGTVSIELVKEAAVNIEASVTSGDIDCDMPLSYDKSGKHATGQVGENPTATLSIKTTSGEVRISQAE